MDDATAPLLTPDHVRPLELADGTVRTMLDRGEGPPLLLIQGMSGTHGHWGPAFLDGLVAAGRRVLSVNHIGVAGSTRSSGPYGIADLAEAQAAALDALGLTAPVDVFGVSMGGMTAQELALRHPDRVRSLVLGCTTPGAPAGVWPDPEDMRGLVEAFQSGDAERALRAGWEMNLSPTFAADPERFAAFTEISRAGRVSLGTITEQLAAIGQHAAGDRLGEIAVPTTVAHGTLDRMLPYANGVAIAEAIPGATLETFDGVGHLFFWEDPERTLRIVRETAARAD
jgi:3-oxoadipate enol-lactonase